MKSTGRSYRHIHDYRVRYPRDRIYDNDKSYSIWADVENSFHPGVAKKPKKSFTFGYRFFGFFGFFGLFGFFGFLVKIGRFLIFLIGEKMGFRVLGQWFLGDA